MGKGYRPGRIGEEIRRIVSDLMLKELKDPRLSGIVSISAVDVTSDGSYATLYVSVLSDTTAVKEGKDPAELQREKEEEVLAAFGKAKGLIRREIGKQIKLRHVPELNFKMDHSMEYGRRISQIIDSLDIKHEDDIEEAGQDEE